MRRAFIALPSALLAGCYIQGPPPPPPEPPPPEIAVAVAEPAIAEPAEAPPVRAEPARRPQKVAGNPFRASASSTYPGWPVTNATDGNPKTSWYSNSNDSAARGRAPYFQIEFAEPTDIHHVRILGNRDPSYPRGYTILAGRLDVLDAEGHVLTTLTSEGAGDLRDFDYSFGRPLADVKVVRFTSVRDEGDRNSSGDVAIAEFEVE